MRTLILNRGLRYLGRKLQSFPPIRKMLEADYARHFAKSGQIRLFYGVHRNFNEALKAISKQAAVGYDQPGPAAMYSEKYHWVFSSDYPVMLWLSRVLGDGSRVFDYGGNVGISFYSFARHVGFPRTMRWQVCDLPAVMEEGKKLAARLGSTKVEFMEDFAAAHGADILLASGALQYIETPLAARLAPLKTKPRHLLINRTPLHDAESFVTLQSLGSGVFCAYQIFNASAFIESLTALGYELVDHWETHDFPVEIPFHPKESLRAMSGLYLKLRTGA